MRSLRWVLVATAFASFAGCSDGSASAEGYFSEMKTIGERTDGAFAELEDETRDALSGVTSAEEAAEVWRSALAETVLLTQTALEELEDLSPPDQVGDEHAAFMDSIRAQFRAAHRLLDDFETLGLEGVAAAFGGQEFQNLELATEEACADLQTAAEDSGVKVNLGCGG
jgi:hypothetical protein